MAFKLFKKITGSSLKAEQERLQRELADARKRADTVEKKNASLREKLSSAKESVEQLVAHRDKQSGRCRELQEKVNGFRKAFGLFLPGKYYSPLPCEEDIARAIANAETDDVEFPDLDLAVESQGALLRQFREYYQDLAFPEVETEGHRYFYDQGWFSYSDAIFYYSFLRHHQPKRIIEVGSGFSSAVALDTVDLFFETRPEMTFIDPNPERLEGLLSSEDETNCRVIREPVQEVDLSVFSTLEAGDLLFIDSSHVLKPGSDLPHVFFSILPRIAPGVFVHFHDVFHPFEYPRKWLEEGRFWNEAYLLRAFLAYNSEWKIHLLTDFATKEFREYLEAEMPLSLRNNSGSVYIQRVAG